MPMRCRETEENGLHGRQVAAFGQLARGTTGSPDDPRPPAKASVAGCSHAVKPQAGRVRRSRPKRRRSLELSQMRHRKLDRLGVVLVKSHRRPTRASSWFNLVWL